MSKPNVRFFSSLQWPPLRSIPKDDDDLFEQTPPAEYDLNTVIPVPPQALETPLVRVEPLVPLLHANELHIAFSTPADDPLFFPAGKPYTDKLQTLKYIETQRRRDNVICFAIIDKTSSELGGQICIGCDPTQSTRDIKVLQTKIFPKFRRTHLVDHARFLIYSYILNPISEGGLGCVRAAGRVIPENTRSLRMQERSFLTKEGTMRCYDVSAQLPGDSPPRFGRVTPDGRLTKDAVIFSITIHDWLAGGIRDIWKAKVDGQTIPLPPRPVAKL